MPSERAQVVRVLSPSAMHSSLEAMVEAYRRSGGGAVQLTFETAPALVQRIAGGEIADIVIAPPRVMDEITAARKADPESRYPLGRAGVGIAVREGAPPPDVSSTDALKRSILEADSIVHTRASSGLYVAQLLERLGLSAVKAKTTTYHDAVGAFTHLLNGKGRELGFGGIPEIRRWENRGLRYVAPLPQDVQNYTTYVAALATGAPDPGARAFFVFLGSPAARAILDANGVE